MQMVMAIDSAHLIPGKCVSMDQLESSTPGRIPIMKGKPSTSNYGAATLFVDHASRFLHLSLHCSTGAQEAIKAKHKFERTVTKDGITIKEYHADNGVSQSKLFQASCDIQDQKITFCGVNAHHQNGIAERQIRTLTERACTMLIHSMH